MREEPGDARLRSRLLAGIWASSTLLLAWHAGADVASGDSGEIGGAAFSLGVAHPTGFPLDMLLLRAFSFVPLGPIAWRENLGVACIAACALTSVARLVCRLSAQLGVRLLHGGAAGASLAVCALLSFRTFLASALGVEVYSTALLLVASAANVLLAQRDRSAWLWPLFGLALSAHVTAGLLMLPLLLAATAQRTSQRRSWPRWVWSRGILVAGGALAVSYLPLAAARDTAFDWGDPETLQGLVRHLSAARIRDAYVNDMWKPGGTPALSLFTQLAQYAWLGLPIALGAVALWRRQRAAALVVLSVLCCDLGYAVWVNPMGIADRQLGHPSGALLALLAGLGAAWSIQTLSMRLPWLGRGASMVTFCAAALLLTAAAFPETTDGYAVGERYGGGSPLLDLPARAVYLCSSDSACASGLFALYVEGVRPDLAIAPAQHLWDATVRRRLTGLHATQTSSQARSPVARRQLADQLALTLARGAERPVYFENWPGLATDSVATIELTHVPWLGRQTAASASAHLSASARLATLERARFGPAGPQTALSRELWSSAHAELGKVLLHVGEVSQALVSLQRAVELTPERAVAHSNLGVGFEYSGDLFSALRETRKAVEFDPERPTPWVNLARLVLRMSGRDAARVVLSAAERQGVRDPRLSALRNELAPSHGKTGK